jgi:hypothetical protein
MISSLSCNFFLYCLSSLFLYSDSSSRLNYNWFTKFVSHKYFIIFQLGANRGTKSDHHRLSRDISLFERAFGFDVDDEEIHYTFGNKWKQQQQQGHHHHHYNIDESSDDDYIEIKFKKVYLPKIKSKI